MTHHIVSTKPRTRQQDAIYAALYREIATHLPGGAVFVVNHALVYLLADGKALGDVGLVPADFEGKTVSDVVGGDMVAQAEADYRIVLQGGSFEREHAVNGQVFLSRGTPLRDENGSIQAALVLSYDITRRVRSENARIEADLQKDQFLALLAHEMRGPLTPLLTGLELFRLRARESEVELLPHAMMERQLRHLTRLVEDLSDQSRLQLGKLTLEKRSVSVKEVITQAIEAASLLIKRKNHTVVNTIQDESLLLEADAARLVQVFTNILQNSAKYSPPGSVIELEARLLEREIEIGVKDNGVGIPADRLHSIFDLFTQLSPSPCTAEQGLGIGLALVKGLVEAHGGQVTCHSEGIGKGSHFIVRLPLSMSRS